MRDTRQHHLFSSTRHGGGSMCTREMGPQFPGSIKSSVNLTVTVWSRNEFSPNVTTSTRVHKEPVTVITLSSLPWMDMDEHKLTRHFNVKMFAQTAFGVYVHGCMTVCLNAVYMYECKYICMGIFLTKLIDLSEIHHACIDRRSPSPSLSPTHTNTHRHTDTQTQTHRHTHIYTHSLNHVT
jgi:hypothetical protein